MSYKMISMLFKLGYTTLDIAKTSGLSPATILNISKNRQPLGTTEKLLTIAYSELVKSREEQIKMAKDLI